MKENKQSISGSILYESVLNSPHTTIYVKYKSKDHNMCYANPDLRAMDNSQCMYYSESNDQFQSLISPNGCLRSQNECESKYRRPFESVDFSKRIRVACRN